MFFNMARRGCAQSLREGLKVVLKDWLMSKLILASCLGSFCNGGLLVAMVLFYSLAIEVRTSSHLPTLSPSHFVCVRARVVLITQHHGLGFDPLRNGIAFTAFAGAGFIFQVRSGTRLHAICRH